MLFRMKKFDSNFLQGKIRMKKFHDPFSKDLTINFVDFVS